ncbi:MAG: hypothetical protein DRJ01_10320 [Bacteroidetes bacterium]|nr:MAG: hypothetical protein DRJ01_10320 [Bacteroidota bacterium]
MSQFLNMIGLSPRDINKRGDTNMRYNSLPNIRQRGSVRQAIISILDDFMVGDSFKHYYERFFERQFMETYNDNGEFIGNKEAGITYEQMKKIYVTYSMIPKAINEMMLLAPTFDNFTTSDKSKINLLKTLLKKIKWKSLYTEIIRTLELKGDFFAYWYYLENDSIPRLKVLESENLIKIVRDSNYEPTAYIYEETRVAEDVNEVTGKVQMIPYTVQTIFKKGYIRVNSSHLYPDKGYKITLNKPFEEDIIRIIHIPSFKNQKDEFSQIPAIHYIDPALIMDNITSDTRYANRMSAFPSVWAIDLNVDILNSSFMPGNLITAKTDTSMVNGHQGKMQQLEITNELKTLQFERDIVNKDFSKKTAIMREELDEEMSKSDSSRVAVQLRLVLSNKYEKYFENIQEGFMSFFKSALISNELYDENTDENLSFLPPDIFINTSIFDNLSIINTKMAMGMTSMEEEWDKKGMSEKDKQRRIENINKEKMMGNDDISISDEVTDIVANGQGLSNEMKQDINIKK